MNCIYIELIPVKSSSAELLREGVKEIAKRNRIFINNVTLLEK